MLDVHTYSLRSSPMSDHSFTLSTFSPRQLSLMIPHPETWIYNGGFPGLAAEFFSRPSRVAGLKLGSPTQTTFRRKILTFDTGPMVGARRVDDDIRLESLFDNNLRVIKVALDDT